MARKVTKICPQCNRSFRARRDAKTCSDFCRKKLHRTKQSIIKEAETLQQTAAHSLDSLAAAIEPPAATEAGYVGSTINTSTPPPLESLEAPSAPTRPAPPTPASTPVPVPTTPAPPVVSWPPPQAGDQPRVINTPLTTPVSTIAPIAADVSSSKDISSPLSLLSRKSLALALLLPAAIVILGLASTYLPRLFSSKPSNNPSSSSAGSSAQSAIGSSSKNFSLTGPNTNLTGSTISLNAPTTLTADSTLAFLVQDTAGASAFTVDTINHKVGINTAPSPSNPASLQVAGDISSNGLLLSSSGLKVANVQICSPSGCLSNSGNASTLAGQPPAFYQNASNLTSGTVSRDRLPSQVAYLDADQSFIGLNTFTAKTTFTSDLMVKSAVNSATAFQVQNANGTSHLIVADTIAAKVAIALPTPTYTLDVGGDINSTTGIRVGGTLICSAGGCAPGGGSGNYIQNSTFLQTANYAIQSVSNSAIVALIRGASGQSADLLRLVAGDSGNNVLSVAYNGATTFKNDSDSTSAFQIQQAGAGATLLTANTTTGQILLPNATSSATALTIGGDVNLYRSAVGTLKTDNKFIAGDNSTSAFTVSGRITANSDIILNGGPASGKYLNINGTAAIGGGAGGGIIAAYTVSSGGVGTISRALWAADGVAAGISVPTRQSVFVDNAVMGAGAAITNNYGLYMVNQTAGTNNYGIYLEGASTATLQLASDAGTAASGIKFGSAGDTNLYREAAGILRTDYQLVAASDVQSWRGSATGRITLSTDGSSRAVIYFGGSNDTNLYRYAANVLATDSGLLGGRFSTTQRDAIPNGQRPTGMMIFNTTTNQYEYNAGTEVSPNWLPFSRQIVYTLAQWPPANPVQNQYAVLSDTYNGRTFSWTFQYRPDLNALKPWAYYGGGGWVIGFHTASYGSALSNGATFTDWTAPIAGDYEAIVHVLYQSGSPCCGTNAANFYAGAAGNGPAENPGSSGAVRGLGYVSKNTANGTKTSVAVGAALGFQWGTDVAASTLYDGLVLVRPLRL